MATSLKKRFVIRVGDVNQTCEQAHSGDSFATSDEALVPYWGFRRTLFPQRVWILCGADGWVCNDSTVGKDVPAHLSAAVDAFVSEDNDIALGGIASDEVARCL